MRTRKVRAALIVEYVLVLATLAAASEPGPKTEPALPRYKLKPGQELVYEGSSRFRYENGSHGTKDRATFWVTRLNPDGSWHIVAHNENSFVQSFGKDEAQATPQRKKEAFDCFDLFLDGRITNAPQGVENRGLSSLFFKLPTDNAVAKEGWEVATEDGERSSYRQAPQNDAASSKLVFEKTEKGIFTEIYLSSSISQIYFDAGRGLITKIETEFTQGYGFNGKGSGLTELKSTTQKPNEWISELEKEADTFVRAKEAVRETLSVIQKGTNATQAASAAEKVLREAQETVKLPIVKAQFEAQLTRLSETANYMVEEKEKQDLVLNQPAAMWVTTDIDGKAHSLTGYRGKVVVLDFWYRGCGWCIRAMPQIKEVAEHYRDKPVVVLGMNTDRQEKDARFVAEKLKLNYPTLKAEVLPPLYKVQGFPTLLIIDQQGLVRARHVGYSPNLREEVIKTVDGLLASK